MVITADLRIKAAAEFELRRRKKTFREYLEMVTPHYQWDPPHLVYSQEYLQMVADGESLKIIFLKPARHGKTTQNTVRFGSYYLYKNPSKKVILGAYNQEYANDLSVQTRQIYRDHMPNEQLKDTEKRWQTNRGGEFKCAGLRGGVTGKGGDLILLDDPVKDAETAYSKNQRDKMWRSYKMDFLTRLEPGGSMIITMTPWHHDGLVNRILNSPDGKNWIVVKMPALAGKNDILGRKEGEALWPERWPREELLKIKAAIGDDEFNALYQVNPVVLSGNLVKREWFVFKDKKDFPVRYDFIGQYWDPAVKKGENNDYYACATIGRANATNYLLNMFREKLTMPEFEDEVINQAVEYRPHYIGIEDSANGSPLIQKFALRNDLSVKPEPIPAKGEKEFRVRCITSNLRNEGLILPKDEYWTSDFLDEICLFPQGKNDDQVDAVTMGITNICGSGFSLDGLIGRK